MDFALFVNTIPNLELVQKYSERIDTLLGIKVTDFTYLPYRIVKQEIREMIYNSQLDEVILLVLKCYKKTVTLKQVKKIDNYEKLKFIFWLQDQVKTINEMERKHLVTPPDPKLVAAGIEELDVLGDDNLIDSLAGGDVAKWEEIRNIPYDIIFRKQLKTNIEARIAKRMEKKKKKNN